MVAMGWLYFAAATCLLSASCLAAAINGEDSVGVTMCCPEGRVLKLEQNRERGLFGRAGPGEYVAKCVRSRRAPKDNLDGGTITVADDEGGQQEMVVKKTGLVLPSCPIGLKVQLISLNISNSDGSYVNETSQPEVFKRVKLGDYYCGHSNCQKGNVYVDDKPVCDDDWDDNDASVVCRELGFNDGGYATKESYFGSVDLENQSGLDQVRCSGRESSLLDCRHEAFDDCGNSEAAGVVCYGEDDGGYSNYSRPGQSSEPLSAILLTSSGQLTIPNDREELSPTTYQTGEFCMAGVWEGGPSAGIGENQAVALMCEPCTSEILCSGVKKLFSDISRRNPEIVGDDRRFPSNNIVLVGDKNGDASVNFEEFKAKIENYVRKVFNWLDLDGDGALDEGVSMKSLSAKLFLEALEETYLFVDINQDDILSVEDAPEGSFRDRNNDGKISLREVFGVSLINLPAPLYRLYATLDKNKNEKISFEEATSFIKGTLYVLDQNEDCSINIDEIIATLEESKLPSEYQLAMKLLGDHYFTLADYFLKQFVTAADVDGDKKTTLAEIIGLKDPAVILSIANVAYLMGEPHRRTSEFLVGEGRRSSRDHRQAVQEMWLNVLYDFVDNRKYGSVSNNFCGLE